MSGETARNRNPAVADDKICCELITWNYVYRLASRLAFVIQESGFQPEVIVAIARGGYVPARILCDFLNVYALTSIRVVHYASGARKKASARVTDSLCTEITGKRVLLVDDVSDTGDTYEVALEHLADFQPAAIKTAVLLHKTTARYQPDFIARRVIKWRWMIYPWAVIEDITGFLDAMDPTPGTAGGIEQALLEKHQLKIPQASLKAVVRVIETRHRRKPT